MLLTMLTDAYFFRENFINDSGILDWFLVILLSFWGGWMPAWQLLLWEYNTTMMQHAEPTNDTCTSEWCMIRKRVTICMSYECFTVETCDHETHHWQWYPPPLNNHLPSKTHYQNPVTLNPTSMSIWSMSMHLRIQGKLSPSFKWWYRHTCSAQMGWRKQHLRQHARMRSLNILCHPQQQGWEQCQMVQTTIAEEAMLGMQDCVRWSSLPPKLISLGLCESMSKNIWKLFLLRAMGLHRTKLFRNSQAQYI